VLSSSNFQLYADTDGFFEVSDMMPVPGTATYADTDGFFEVSDMMPVPGTATEAAMVFCRMQLVTGHLASHGVLLDAEA
jgi:hypothetical protein